MSDRPSKMLMGDLANSTSDLMVTGFMRTIPIRNPLYRGYYIPRIITASYIFTRDKFKINPGYSCMSVKEKIIATRNAYKSGRSYKIVTELLHPTLPSSNIITTWRVKFIDQGAPTHDKKKQPNFFVGMQSVLEEKDLGKFEEYSLMKYIIFQGLNWDHEYCCINSKNDKIYYEGNDTNYINETKFIQGKNPVKQQDIIKIELISFNGEYTARFYTNDKLNVKHSFNKSGKWAEFQLFVALARRDSTVQLLSFTQHIYQKTVLSTYNFASLLCDD